MRRPLHLQRTRRSAKETAHINARQPEIISADVRKSSLLPPRNLSREKIKRLVRNNRAANRKARLHPRIRRLIHRRKRIRRLNIPVAQKAIRAPMRRVRPGLRHNVHHAARGAPILRREPIRDDLELLHRVLRNRRARAAGDVVPRIRAINVDRVRPRTHPPEVQPRRRNRPNRRRRIPRDLRVGQRKANIVAAIRRKILDAQLIDGSGLRAALRLDDIGAAGDRYHLVCCANRQVERKLRLLSNGEDDVLLH